MTVAFNPRIYNVKNTVMTAQMFKEFYLHGVDLTNDDGTPINEGIYNFMLLKAQNWLEQQIPGLSLFPITVPNETHDYYINDYQTYNFIKLFRYPVTDVSAVGLQFPLATNVLNFDPSWFRTESVAGQTQLVPTQGTFSSILLGQGGNFLPLLYNGIQNVPALFRITYTAGFAKNQIPQNILDIIGLKASIIPLTIAGDLIAGAGVAAKSLSIDGLSQSLTTTASAENTGYTANVKQREKEIQSLMKDLKAYYTGIQMTVA